MSAAALAVGGTGLSVMGQIEEAEARAAEARRQAAIGRLRAQEIEERAVINEKAIKKRGDKTAGEQVAAFAKGGVDVGKGTAATAIEETANEVMQEVMNTRREARFEAHLARLGADSTEQAAKQLLKAGQVRAAGTLLSGAGNMAANKPG